MRKLLPFLFIPVLAFAQSSMDAYRWYLNPQGQDILISIDDLHDETIPALPSMDWGRSAVSGITLKKEVVVAVIDGGIEIEHPELKDHIAYNLAECYDGNIIPPKGGEDKDANGYKGDCAGWDFVADQNREEDLDGHGTHVTGIINSVMHGVQGSFKFLPLKVFAPDEGRQTVSSSSPLSTRLNKAFEYALARKVDVIHLSVGWPKSFMTYELEQTIKKVIASGVIVVAAAGNSSQRATVYPCQMEGVICVGALRPNGEVARFSNWGTQVDIFGPGEKILSTIPFTLAPLHISRKGYDYKNGTSQAAPFISGAMAILKGLYPDETSDSLYARLMSAANAPIGDSGLKGLFQLEKAIQSTPEEYVFPQLKGIYGIVVDASGVFNLALPLKNYGPAESTLTSVKLLCQEATLESNELSLDALKHGETRTLTFKGQLNVKTNVLNCELQSKNEVVRLKLKVIRKLPGPFKKVMVKQDDLLVVSTRTGGRSRFMTLNPLNGAIPGPFYYITGMKDLTLYREDLKLGTIVMKDKCNFLRAWQVDLDGDPENEIMIESMCDKTHLFYQFFDLSLKELYPGVKYRPSLTIVNYDEFEVIPQKGLPPIFRFINGGFAIPSESPWDSNVMGQAMHLYELFPVKDKEEWKFDVRVLEDTKAWIKSLGLRFLPSVQIFHYIKGKLLVKLGQKTAWIDVKTQAASWANLDEILLLGSKKQVIHGSNELILQSFLTPFEYRGFVMNGVKLRFKQDNRFDPILDVLGTQVNAEGYLTILRSFQKLIYLQYDFTGKRLSQVETVVDRFDFLTAQDLVASVVNLPVNGDMLQLVDGTKVNTGHVDLVLNKKLTSFEIPFHCVTQQPVVMEGKAVLPVFCGKSKNEFEMRYISLQ